MFIDPETYYESSSLRRSETLFDEVENVLVLKRDVKLSEVLRSEEYFLTLVLLCFVQKSVAIRKRSQQDHAEQFH